MGILMDNLTKDLHDICAFWTFNLLSKLEYDGNGNFYISKKEVDKVKKTITTPYKDLDIEEKKLLNSQSNRLIMSIISEV